MLSSLIRKFVSEYRQTTLDLVCLIFTSLQCSSLRPFNSLLLPDLGLRLDFLFFLFELHGWVIYSTPLLCLAFAQQRVLLLFLCLVVMDPQVLEPPPCQIEDLCLCLVPVRRMMYLTIASPSRTTILHELVAVPRVSWPVQLHIYQKSVASLLILAMTLILYWCAYLRSRPRHT